MPSPPRPCESLVDRFDVELLRVEVFVGKPLSPLLVFWVSGVLENFQEFLITIRSTTILWGTGTLTCEADRIPSFLFYRQNLLDDDFMLPGVTEVVQVMELLLFIGNQLAESCFSFVQHIFFRVPWITIRVSKDVKLMEMPTVLAHDCLKYFVEIAKSSVACDLNPSPYGRFDAAECYLELIDSLLAGFLFHGHFLLHAGDFAAHSSLSTSLILYTDTTGGGQEKTPGKLVQGGFLVDWAESLLSSVPGSIELQDLAVLDAVVNRRDGGHGVVECLLPSRKRL